MSGLSTDALAGIVVGVVGIFVTICLSVLCYCFFSKNPEELYRLVPHVPPRIIAHPQGQQDVVGRVEFTVEATGGGRLVYHWEREVEGTWQSLTDETDGVHGTSTGTLVIDPVAMAHKGNYRCVVSSHVENLEDDLNKLLQEKIKYPEAISNSANLTVGDINGAEQRRRVVPDAPQGPPGGRVIEEMDVDEPQHNWPAGQGRVLGQQQEAATPGPKLKDRPTLRLLRNFPAGKKRPGKTFDILEAIGASYRTFGIFLLRDNDGAKMNALEDTGKRSPYKIAEGIITEWRQGHGKTPVTYKTLVSCLRDAKLKVLASDIEKASGVNMESRPELDAMKKLQIGSKTPFDVIQKIGVHYKDVGIWLLEDDDGSKVANIADEIGCSFDSVVICAKIIEQWTQREEGRATWEELERCIRDARLTVLADDMMEVLQK